MSTQKNTLKAYLYYVLRPNRNATHRVQVLINLYIHSIYLSVHEGQGTTGNALNIESIISQINIIRINIYRI